ncbi:signal transduction histidine-protein kinase/phosphatase UhpB [Avibacterium paragallinarum]|uniref:signal transduction histidine-protein kinase/phosphatase UhpB n=1 Tax=Avibacterium paragallinarum TaxID=728 RepID=UPI0006150BEA|nr:signal transduction histidine-protein kinase/phosphatase UhpB [Avibacterium paragallinarum]KAA6209208.1 signal transduction histidine-protein kinase/phosphatase UhpB [Avibacterium paragallinarum]KKB01394.1 histidine kinase [Avibacterium paragallinarum]RZN71951.1 signal transduction histidine-protein kinase/phosphatase UhpB [Avibacterium paragallinarum]
MNAIFFFIYSWFFVVPAYFGLWIISNYLLEDPLLSFLFFPFALRIGILIHTKIKYWFSIYLAEYSILLLLYIAFPENNTFSIIFLGLLNIPLLLIFKKYYFGSQLRCLLLQGLLISLLSLINALYFIGTESFYFTFLVSFSSAVLIIPICYLIYYFLFEIKWLPLTSSLIRKPISLRSKPIIIYLLLFILNIYIQTDLPESFNRFSLFFLSIPIILLAFRYGWQGALLGILLNSLALISTTHHFSNLELTDLLLTLSAQTITGIFLGLGIQHQRDLNQHLSQELARNQYLTQQLIHREEEIRKEISRELHDEIGQNITAIRTQASILKRIGKTPEYEKLSQIIEQLSLNIYDSIKGLINKIRPRILDDLNLQEALQNLFIELDFASQNTQIYLHCNNPKNRTLSHLLEITLYRLCQEALNNIKKYSGAKEVNIYLNIDEKITLQIQDNGIGFDLSKINHTGLGIKGMKERVAMLGGKFDIHSVKWTKQQQSGTSIFVELPWIN